MKEKFIEIKSLGFLDAICSNIWPVDSSDKARLVLYSSARKAYQVRRENGAIRIAPLGRFDREYVVSRGVQETDLDIDCGLAYDEWQLEYKTVCKLKFSFTVKDEEEAIEKIVRDFDSEYQRLKSFIGNRIRELVRDDIQRLKIVHSVLDTTRCHQALLDALEISKSPICFCVIAVTSASFGDSDWGNNPRRLAAQAEAIAKLKHEQEIAEQKRQAALHKATTSAAAEKARDDHEYRLGNVGREHDLLKEQNRITELRNENTRKAEQFRRELENDDAQAKLILASDAFKGLGEDAALVIFFPNEFALKAGHAERMRDPERKALEQHKAELLKILQEAIKQRNLPPLF